MSEMVQRVIEAIRSADHTSSTMETIARAAIAAIREPTEAMLIAGGADDDEIFHRADYRKAWQKMVDEMLK